MAGAPTSTRPEAGDILRYVAVAAILIVGGVHLEQYRSFISEVPTIGTLFILNAAGAAGIALGITAFRGKLAAVSAAAGVALAAGALVSITIALNGTLFGYQEPTARPSITIAIVAEIVSVIVLAALAVREMRSDAS